MGELTQSEIARERAKCFFDTLSKWDVRQRERQELLDSGVSQSVVWALYPATFADSSEGIRRQLSSRGCRGLRNQDVALTSILERVKMVRDSLNSEQEARYHEDFAKQSGISPALLGELHFQFELAALPAAQATFVAGALWYLWWFGQHLDELTYGQRDAVERCAAWFGDFLLHL